MRLDFKLKKQLKDFLRKKIEEQRDVAYLITPYKFSEKELSLIKEKLPFLKTKRIKNIIDNSLIAGFKIKIGSKVIDYSVKYQLNSLKQYWYENLG